ncbi:MAG TPA: LysR family transcriptional regulator [Solirubrobacteraceae bacterium]|nr:LysR family transcriptional regulator [Solirubrobacteraceae bacterium]
MPFKPAQLRYFVTVAEEGQVTSAAKRLEIAQPALSQAISQLESELGLQLLERHSRGVRLTPDGESFLPKARIAVETAHDAEREALSLARRASGTVEVGFVGPPPTISAPDLFAEFRRIHPDAELSFRDLPFPRGTTRSWLEEVDVAYCHQPDLEPGIRTQRVRFEPRAIVAHTTHPLAKEAEAELRLDAVLDQTFIGYHPDVQPSWAAFHSLDDHRGGPPRAITAGHASTSLQMLGIMSTGAAITAVPACDAKIAHDALPDLIVFPLRDAAPAVLSLVCPSEGSHPLADALLNVAASVAASEPERELLDGKGRH